MWHTILISAHAVTATAALTAGVVAVPRARMFGVYLGSLIAMEVFLVLAIAVEWQVIDAQTRFVFAALAGLGAVVMWCGLRAGRVRPRDDAGPTATYVENIGFTLVALVDAFLVIAVLNARCTGMGRRRHRSPRRRRRSSSFPSCWRSAWLNLAVTVDPRATRSARSVRNAAPRRVS